MVHFVFKLDICKKMKKTTRQKRSIKDIRTMREKDLKQLILEKKVELVEHPDKSKLKSNSWNVFQLPKLVNDDGNEKIIPGYAICKLLQCLQIIRWLKLSENLDGFVFISSNFLYM